MIQNIMELYHIFDKNMINDTWWPAENPWEIAVGAVLVQNTNWKNVNYSLNNIRQTVGFNPAALITIENQKLQELIRPSGFFKNKSLTIQALFSWFEQYDFDLQVMNQSSFTSLRQELLAIKGIGYETADVILVYVLEKSAFIADKYAQRLFNKLGLEETLNYTKLQNMIALPEDFSNEQARKFHSWILEYGKIHLKNDAIWQTGFLADFHLDVADSFS